MISTKIPNLTFEKKWSKLNYFSEKTMNEVIELLNQYGRAIVIRPTGFGKTRLLVKLAKIYSEDIKKKSKRILYVYPLDVIKTEIFNNEEYIKDGIIEKNVDFIAYNTLTNNTRNIGKDKMCLEIAEKYSLIILDEVHRAGSDGFMELYEEIKEKISNDGLHIIGATATPNRMDDTEEDNIVNSIFEGHKVSDFTLTDSIIEGIMPKPVYGKCEYNLEGMIESFKDNMKNKCNKKGTNFNEDSFNVELGKTIRNVGGASKFIYRYIKKAGYDITDYSNSYYKFIVFFNNISDMAERGETVEEWFTEAFNREAKKENKSMRNFKTRIFYVASDDTEDRKIQQIVKLGNGTKFFLKKADKLNDIKEKNKTIDLLFTVNMINMGYHVKNITGVGLMRGTKSEIVYYQQIGRCLSVTATKSPIILDFVNNIGERFKGKQDTKRRDEALSSIMGANNTNREDKQLEPMDMFITGDEDSVDKLLERFSDVNYCNNMEIKWLYENRMAPICLIAADTGKTCKEIIEILIRMSENISKEDPMYHFVQKEIATRGNLLKYIISNKASMDVKKEHPKEKTIFDVIKTIKNV